MMANTDNEMNKTPDSKPDMGKNSRKNADKNKGESRQKYKDMFSKLSEIDSSYTESVSEGFKPFRPDNYEDNLENPENFNMLEDGTLIADPKVEGKWSCKYYYPPGYKAHLFRSIFLLMLLIFMLITFLFTSTLYFEIGFTLSIIVALFVNVIFRYYDLAVFGNPMPMIPGASMFFYKFFTNEYAPQEEDEEDEEDEEYEGYEGYIVENNTIDPVEDVKNGNPSPATILTRWMNSEDVRWTSEDLIENSGGFIDSFTLKMLLKNNEDAWTDEEIVDNISIITGSNPIQWINAFNDWKAS